MQRITRYALVIIGLTIVGLLALGALPGLVLGSGPYYYLEVTPIEEDGPAVTVDEISERQYPYLTGAFEADDGRSDGYQRGPGSVKEWFTHSPFDEHSALIQHNPDAVLDDDRVAIERDGQVYSVEIVREDEH